MEIELTCEQSTSLIPKVVRGDLDLALVSRDKPQRGRLLFQEPLVWVGAPQFEVWRKDPLPIAVYESAKYAHPLEKVKRADFRARRGTKGSNLDVTTDSGQLFRYREPMRNCC